MKIKPVYWIALGLVLALTVAVCDGLRLHDKYSIAIGKYEEALAQAKTLNAEKDKAIVDAKATITLQTAKIAELLGNAGIPTATEIAQDKIIAEQKRRLAEFEAQDNLPAALEAAKSEIQAWSDKFTLAEKRHETELFDLNAAWAAKYDAQVTISESWKQKYEGETRLRTLAEKGWKASERKLRWARIGSNIEKLVILGLGAKVAVDALKGAAK